jgi:hypothetical protein
MRRALMTTGLPAVLAAAFARRAAEASPRPNQYHQREVPAHQSPSITRRSRLTMTGGADSEESAPLACRSLRCGYCLPPARWGTATPPPVSCAVLFFAVASVPGIANVPGPPSQIRSMPVPGLFQSSAYTAKLWLPTVT